MIDRPLYTPYHPRWIRPHISAYWWLGRGVYLLFILRELSSIFVAGFVLYLLFLIRAIGQGPAQYEEFLRWSARPSLLLMNIVSLLFIVFHAITWFNLAPKAMAVRVGGTRVPGALIAGSNYAAWIVASALIAWVLLGA